MKGRKEEVLTGKRARHSYFTPSMHSSGYFLDKADKESLVTYTHELMCTV